MTDVLSSRALHGDKSEALEGVCEISHPFTEVAQNDGERPEASAVIVFNPDLVGAPAARYVFDQNPHCCFLCAKLRSSWGSLLTPHAERRSVMALAVLGHALRDLVLALRTPRHAPGSCRSGGMNSRCGSGSGGARRPGGAVGGPGSRWSGWPRSYARGWGPA